VPKREYAVFQHRGHVAGVRSTFVAIWNDWLPKSGRQVAEAPSFERYGPEFNPQTGLGGFEIWIPLET
jgi:AraC family transcriptional regulator